MGIKSVCSLGLLMLLMRTVTMDLSDNDCTFPKYLQSTHSGTWLNRVRNQGRFDAKHHLIEVIFDGGLMMATVSSQFDAKDVEDSYTRECLNVTGDTFIVSHTPLRKSTTFMCVEFYHQSKSVVFLRISPTQKDRDAVNCDDLFTENWPLVMKEAVNGQVVPPALDRVVGSYDINPVGEGRMAWTAQCATDIVPLPNMEIACLPRDVLTINFHVLACVFPNLLMTKFQKLFILGVWEYSDYVFMLLKADRRPNFWCARFQKSNILQRQIDMVIFLDLVCDPTPDFIEGKNRMEFELSKNLGSIPNNSPLGATGHIEPEYQGRWMHMDGKTIVNVTQNTVYLPEQGLYELWDDGEVDPVSGLLRVPLGSTSHDGCSPKAVCLEIGHRNVNVLRYKMGTTVVLEKGKTYEDPYAEFCRSDLFTDDRYTHLIRMKMQERVDCDLFKPNQWFQYHTVGEDNKQCAGEFKVPCFKDHLMQVSHNTCPMFPTYLNNHVCMASFPEKRGGRVIITKHELPDDSRAMCCWIFKKSQKLMFYAHAKDCDENTAENYELYEEGKHYLTMFIIKEVNHTCTAPTEGATSPSTEPTKEPEPELEIHTVAVNEHDDDLVGGAQKCKVSHYATAVILLAYLI